ncbi:multidrug DMT transporter permease [Dietzia sp. NCCP-2495]|uniref:BCCT family transporter n=1 Tax=Dietzia sp. NCCP-2495 TaxID=2934675 RepID=UPI00222F914C|nr:BCCT family transporter [Dietzia sp. NCCP-2495]GLB63028.1 multidrug DMT transporter permease [Dietzia sp. NCCP-2495]
MSERITRALRLKTDPGVFLTTVGIILAFVVITFLAGDWVGRVFGTASGWIMTNLGWFYILGVTTFLGFLIWVAMSRFGHVRLGGDDEEPEHSTLTWFAMLFAAGIGSILMFWGVAEPISHFAAPPRGNVEPGTVDAAQEAMAFTLYHFGLHTWTIFALPSLAFAYFIYKRKMPPRLSSIFAPLLGDKIFGPIGKTIDIVALIGTVFGVATSVGLGTLQINAGLNELFGIEMSPFVQVLTIAIVTTVACISVALGLEKGIKRLSNANIVMAVALLIFILVTGPTLFLLKGTVESLGVYLTALPELALWNNVFPASDDLASWQNTWTVFYWAWTITWSPFVGIFIARISRGRTIRGFVFGVLGLPVAFSVLWFGIFGMASFHIELFEGGGLAQKVSVEGDIPGALFGFLSHYPLATLLSGLAVVLVVVFFTTSVDSAAMVVDMIASGKDDEVQASPAHQRVIWAVLMGAVGATILAGTGEGGLTALQEVITVIGLPFFVIAFVMMFSLVKGLRDDMGERLPTVTRQWDRAYSPEELEVQEEAPSPEPVHPLHQIPDPDNGVEEDDGAPAASSTATSATDQEPNSDR